MSAEMQASSTEHEPWSEVRLQARCQRLEHSVVVQLDNARLDAFVAPELTEYLSGLDLYRAERVVFDLGRVEVLDSSALAALLRAVRQLASGVEVRLVAASDSVRRLLRLTEVDRLVPVHASVASALSDDDPPRATGDSVTRARGALAPREGVPETSGR